MSLRLYDIAAEYRALAEMLDGDDEAVDRDSFLLALDALAADFTDKATNLACLIRELSAEADAVNETATQLRARAGRLHRRAEGLEDYLRTQMQASGLHQARDARIRVMLRHNPPSVRLDAPEAIPALYCRVIPQRLEADKVAIKAALAAGEAVPGASLVRTTRLEIQ